MRVADPMLPERQRAPAPEVVPAPHQAWRWYAALALLAGIVCAWSTQPWATIGATVVQASAALAVVVGVVRRRPPQPLAWWLLAAALATFAAAQAYWRIGFAGAKPDIPFRNLNDVLYFASFVLFAASLAAMSRRKASRWPGFVDGTIVVLGLSSGTWRFLIEPHLATTTNDPTGIALFLSYEMLELLRLA